MSSVFEGMPIRSATASEQNEQHIKGRWLCRGMRPKDAPSDIGFMTLGGKSSISEVKTFASCHSCIESAAS